MLEGSSITAVLGPTNTGKTHRAVERMLSYDTGMIGLPLRLLAREVYDRVTARLGESRVALVTGEEKRVPRRPDYWVCTVEAMPVEREVDFLAIDEIQLCAHPQRGHVFTERLLSARGKRETWFLGAATMRQMVTELVPTARFAEHPRLSKLSFAGAERLTRLPPRSAVVAFSTPQVYEIAERLRQASGGCAVVLGALSPRTRNAQVAMFQAGEVDRIVATDAIGMGLNLHVSHVAFASLRKFDGRDVRELDPAEIAQIAGRAGRHQNDGTFGTLDPLFLSPDVAADIESHRFPPVTRLVWRNAELDFSSVDALAASLRKRPRARPLRLVEDPDDTAALNLLAQDPTIRDLARGEDAVRLLWDVCTIPDFKKLLLESHATLLAQVFAQLAGPRQRLDQDWIAGHIAEIDDVSGDIDTLLGRIASIRTFTYISHRPGWVADAEGWQERARAVEDRLSDALHDRLVQRFVERGKPRKGTASKPRPASPRAREDVYEEPPRVEPSHPFAKLAALRARLAPTPAPPPAPVEGRWVEDAVASPDEAFSIDASGKIVWQGRQLGQLTRGSRLTLPDVNLTGSGDLGAGARSRLGRRLVAVARDATEQMLGSLRRARASLSPEAQELAYLLEKGLGTALVPAGITLADADREALAVGEVEVGDRVAYLPRLLKPAAVELRVALCAAFLGPRSSPERPKPGVVSFVPRRGIDPAAYLAIGYPVFGTRALRADVVERVFQALRQPEGEGRPDAALLASWMGCPAREVRHVTVELGAALPSGSAASCAPAGLVASALPASETERELPPCFRRYRPLRRSSEARRRGPRSPRREHGT